MASNIYHMAEQDMAGPHEICVSGICFGDRFQQISALQAQMAFRDVADLTVWIALSDGNGSVGIIPLISVQPYPLQLQGMLAIISLLSGKCATPKPISCDDLRTLRDANHTELPSLPEHLGAVARFQLAPEISQLDAHLWLARHSETDLDPKELQIADQLACVLAANLDREIDLYMRERSCRSEQRMTDLAQQIADLFAAPGMPISSRFRAMLDTCCSAFDMDQGYVTLLKEQQPTLQFCNTRMCYPEIKRDAASEQVLFSAQLLKDPVPLALENVAASAYADNVDLTGAHPGRYLGCPIRFDGQTHGTIEMTGSTAAASPYTQAECAMLRTLSIYAAGPLVLLGEALSF